MAKEIRGHAMPDPKVYVPTPGEREPNQSGGAIPWAAQAGGSGPNAGPGFAFDGEQLNALANKWDDLASRYRNAREQARQLIEANGPGLEFASVGNAEEIQASGKALETALEDRAQYCQTVAMKFRDATGRYAAIDDEAEATVNDQGGKFR